MIRVVHGFCNIPQQDFTSQFILLLLAVIIVVINITTTNAHFLYLAIQLVLKIERVSRTKHIFPTVLQKTF